MNRRQFVERALAAGVALYLPAAAAPAELAPITITFPEGTFLYSNGPKLELGYITSNGGFTTPMNPLYDVYVARVSDVLPRFTAKRGRVSFVETFEHTAKTWPPNDTVAT